MNGYFDTALALLTIYFYDNTFNVAKRNYYDQFSAATACNSICISSEIQSNPDFFNFVTYSIYPLVYGQYQSVKGNLCDGIAGQCSFGNLTYNQWQTGAILNNPPDWLGTVSPDQSYVDFYKGYTVNTYPVEAFFYGIRSGVSMPTDSSITDVYQAWQIAGFFDPKIFSDLLVSNATLPWEQSFVKSGTPYYLKYIALNLGLGGLFTLRTPAELIEGYTDPHIEYFSSKPVFTGGDASINPVVKIDPQNTVSPFGNVVSLFTGESNDALVRTFGLWNGNANITVPGKVYTETKTTEDIFLSPWAEPVPVQGTDGYQF